VQRRAALAAERGSRGESRGAEGPEALAGGEVAQRVSFVSGAVSAVASAVGTAASAVAGAVVAHPYIALGLGAVGAKLLFDYYHRFDVIFWNAQRYGEGVSAAAKDAFVGQLDAEYMLLCEVVGADRQLAVRRQNKLKNRAALGYNAIRWRERHALAEEPIDNYDTVSPGNSFTGDYKTPASGNRFAQSGSGEYGRRKQGQSIRKVAYVDLINGAHVYLYHANASRETATGLVDWVAGHLSRKGQPFVLVGDLNCEPATLTLPAGVQIAQGGPTHPAGAPRATLDYAVYAGCDVGLWVLDAPNNPSDHRAVGLNINGTGRWLRRKVGLL
jgi:hypothetical protein